MTFEQEFNLACAKLRNEPAQMMFRMGVKIVQDSYKAYAEEQERIHQLRLARWEMEEVRRRYKG